MTTLAEARERIYEQFETDWGATSDFTFDNEDYTPPANTQWVRLAVRHNNRAQETLGGVGQRKFESAGSVYVQCFVPLDAGAGPADTLAQAARTIFEGKTIGTTERLRFTSADVKEIGPTKDGWYMTVMEALFTYTEVK